MVGIPQEYQARILDVSKEHGDAATVEDYQNAFKEQWRLKTVALRARKGA